MENKALSKSDQDDKWPDEINSREDLDRAIEAGFNSGSSAESIDDILARVLKNEANG